jgi:cytochrome c5
MRSHQAVLLLGIIVLFLVPGPCPAAASDTFSLRGMVDSKAVFESRCSPCHTFETALQADCGKAEWRVYIDNKLQGQERLSVADRARVIPFLATASTLNRTCLVCHPHDRCLGSRGDAARWLRSIRKMKLRIESGLSREEEEALAAYLAVTCPEK